MNFKFFSARKTKTKRDEDFKYGNYRNYYYKRLGNGSEQIDIRLQMMEQHSECFKGKRILDIGCNSGFITINIAKLFQPKSIVGVDIDPELISIARRQVEKQKTDSNSNDALNNVIFRTVSFNPAIYVNLKI